MFTFLAISEEGTVVLVAFGIFFVLAIAASFDSDNRFGGGSSFDANKSEDDDD
jgi:hypothetical protein